MRVSIDFDDTLAENEPLIGVIPKILDPESVVVVNDFHDLGFKLNILTKREAKYNDEIVGFLKYYGYPSMPIINVPQNCFKWDYSWDVLVDDAETVEAKQLVNNKSPLYIKMGYTKFSWPDIERSALVMAKIIENKMFENSVRLRYHLV